MSPPSTPSPCATDASRILEAARAALRSDGLGATAEFEALGPSSTLDERVGTTIADRYRLLERIGRGGMGVVYLGEHVRLGRRVAVKLLAEELVDSPDAVARFLREARAASAIGHENIVDVLDCGQTPPSGGRPGEVWLVMELLDGRDLGSTLRERGPLDDTRARRIALQICRALGAAHRKGVVHRDLKPDNVYLTTRRGADGSCADDELVKVLDFGVASIVRGPSSDPSGDGPRLTRPDIILGTPEYTAPEQITRDAPDHRVDVYSLGVVLYEMLTGTLPFAAATAAAVFSKQLFEEPVPPRERVGPGAISPATEAVVLRALAKDRARRFSTMADFAAALEACGPFGGRRPRMSAPPRWAALTDPLADARLADARGDVARALAHTEAAVARAGSLDAPELQAHLDLLARVYTAACAPLDRVVRLGRPAARLDARAAFLLSRVDASIRLSDLLDVAAMPRLEALRTLALLLRDGALAV